MNFPIAIFGGGPGEIVIILGILLLLFGSTKLPKLARSLGSSVTEFRKGLRGEDDKKKVEGGDGDEPSKDESAGDKPAGDDKPKDA